MAESSRTGSAALEEAEEDELETELPFPCALPEGLRPDWPAPRRAVLATRSSILAWIEYASVRASLGTISRLPPRPRAGVVGVLARAAKAIDRRHSDAARTFLQQALGPSLCGPELEARVLQSYRHLLDVSLDGVSFQRRFPGRRILDRCEIEMSEEVRRVRDSKAGSILATPHLGDWEVGSAVMPWLGFDPFYAISKPPQNRPLSLYAHRIREERGVRLVPRRGAMKDAAAIVRAGGMLGMMLDQRARTRPVLAPFFGRTARCDRGAAVLLKRLRAPIVVGACYRGADPWRWRVVLSTVLRPEDLEGRSVEEITGLVNREMEKLILGAPEQYFWLHDRYRGA